MKNKENLIQNIKNSNLSEDDKLLLIKDLEKNNYNSFLQKLFYFVNLTKNLIDFLPEDDGG